MSQTDNEKRWTIRLEIARLKHRQYSLFFKYGLAFFVALIFVSLFGSFSLLNNNVSTNFENIPFKIDREFLLTLGTVGSFVVVGLFWYLFSDIYRSLGIIEDWEDYPMLNVPKIQMAFQKVVDQAQQQIEKKQVEKEVK